jgi:hypothetical protein
MGVEGQGNCRKVWRMLPAQYALDDMKRIA